MHNSLMVKHIALVLGIIGVLVSVSITQADEIRELRVKNGQYQPNSLSVKSSTPFKIRITNADKSPIEFESFSLNREREVASGQTVIIYLPALAHGTYEFFDDFHKGNKGTIVVE
jgi:Cupredoxin-like domain